MNYFTSEADFNKGRHAPHRYHTDAFGAFGGLARNPNVWRAVTRLARRRSIRSVATSGPLLVGSLACTAGICMTRYNHFFPPFL